MTYKDLKEYVNHMLEWNPEMTKQWRHGQAVFNILDTFTPLARTVQFEHGIDCFHDDDKVDEFIAKVAELLTQENTQGK